MFKNFLTEIKRPPGNLRIGISASALTLAWHLHRHWKILNKLFKFLLAAREMFGSFRTKHLWWSPFKSPCKPSFKLSIKLLRAAINIKKYTFLLISDTFISNVRLKLTKNEAKAKQHPEAELLLFENYSLFLSTFSSKINRRYLKKYQKQMTLFKCGYIINDNENETEIEN